MLLHEIVRYAATASPSATALVGEGQRLTFAELDARVRAAATVVAERVEPGRPVVIVSDNHLDVVTALYAVPLAGAVLAFSNTRHTVGEVLALVDGVAPALVLADADQLHRLAAPLAERGIEVVSIGPTNGGPSDAAPADLAGLIAAVGATDGVDRGAAADDCAWLIHTSGTTGRPKGVMLTHRSLLAAVTNTAIARPLADDDVYLFPFPLFHVAAYNVLHAHLRRRPVVLMRRFDAAAMLELARAESVTSCSLAPTMLAMLLDAPERRSDDLTGLRQISYGASSMPLDLLLRVSRELPHCGLAQGYGMTELSGNAVFLTPEDHRRAATDAPELLAAAGRPGPLVSLRIVDEQDREVAPGEPGEILVSGDQVAPGYWNDPAATEAARLGPWLRTGDVGRLVEGVLYIVDRKKDLIISGGENVSSREVEDLVGTHPSVGQVAVVGLADQRWGELVCAVVTAAPGRSVDPEELIEWTRGRLAGFKRPRRVVVVDELPTNASGKVDKAVVRTRLTAEVGPTQPG